MESIITVLSIIGALLIVGIIIMVHELGHYSIGRACKIKIVEFAVGFGPKIKSWVKNDIIYSVRWIFLGGFTKFYGEDQELQDSQAFNKQPAGRRALTIAAGPAFNIILAVIIAIIVLTCFGEYVPVVAEVWEGSPAQEAGMEPGDVILEMNGVKMDFYMETAVAQREANDERMPITLLRGGQEISLDIPLKYYESYEGEPVGRNMAGFSYGSQNKSFGFFEAIALSFKWTYLVVKETLLLIFGLFAGRGMENARGIAGIVDELSFALKRSFEYLLHLIAAINISLAVANLLPLPALDGGRLVFIAIEKIFRKPVPRNVEGMIHFVGFVLLFGVMILFLFRDVTGFLGG